jgi:hypothetical protein
MKSWGAVLEMERLFLSWGSRGAGEAGEARGAGGVGEVQETLALVMGC